MLKLKWRVTNVTERVYLSVGTNMGDRLAQLQQAVVRLGQTTGITVDAVSSVYETQPWGKLDQANFYNIAVALTTTLAPEALLAALHQVEQAGHRERHEHWGPRTIDLDIAFWGDRQIQTADLIVPHPRAAERNFVLLPIQELTGNDPIVGDQVAQALRANRDSSWIKKVKGVTIDHE